MAREEIQFCTGGGCTAKLGAGALRRILDRLPKHYDPNLLVGFNSSDDAAVYKLSDDIAIVQTLDFFPPMVEDPYTFGQIAAANSLSDVYAMGGRVITAMNIVCFPEQWDLNILGAILQGGSEKVIEAGGVLAGGHSIADTGVKYGLSVTGVIHPDKVLQNNSCKAGDLLILTKPLGTGIVCSADRLKAAPKESMDEAVKSMSTLNRYAMEVFGKYEVHGCTDVTGFGLMVHLSEMLQDSFSADIFADQLPVIEHAKELADEFYLTAAGQRNRNFVGEKVDLGKSSFATQEILFDAQTSGGILASVAEKDAENAFKEIEDLGMKCGIIGQITDLKDKLIYIHGGEEE